MNIIQIEKGKCIADSVREQVSQPYSVFGVFGQGRLYRLDTVAEESFPAKGLTLQDTDGYRIYYHTVLSLFMAALSNLYPDLRASAEHFIGDALYIAPVGEYAFTSEQLKKIEEQMRAYAEEDIPIERKRLSYEEALDRMEKEKREDALKLYRHVRPDTIDMIFMAGHYFLFHNYLAPSAFYARNFSIKPYYPGLLLLFETAESEGEVPVFREQRNLAKTYQVSRNELRLLQLETAGEISEAIAQGRTRQIMHTIDLQLEHRLRDLALRIQKDDDIRLILVAGPSSSGKTTFSKKLSSHLRALGKRPITLSMDDYFIDRAHTPLDEDGTPNFEAAEAVDMERFNRDMLTLLEGSEVQMPRYDFLSGKSFPDGRILRIDRHHPMIIEGIHGLNPRMTETIPEKNKIKVYISALTQLNIDYNNRIAATDVRFLRRLVRDHKFRGHDAERTFELWQKVRRSEDREIFRFQEEADVSLDTSLAYELFVLKPYAEALLKTVQRKSPYWKDAKRLLRFLAYFMEADASLVSDTSLLREFIGGSYYEDANEWM
ncbi:MAG: nucleoside kinase [Tissierellia bacterium]|nr:nucleoside kinase [Tissierellia bacterium]